MDEDALFPAGNPDAYVQPNSWLHARRSVWHGFGLGLTAIGAARVRRWTVFRVTGWVVPQCLVWIFCPFTDAYVIRLDRYRWFGLWWAIIPDAPWRFLNSSGGVRRVRGQFGGTRLQRARPDCALYDRPGCRAYVVFYRAVPTSRELLAEYVV